MRRVFAIGCATVMLCGFGLIALILYPAIRAANNPEFRHQATLERAASGEAAFDLANTNIVSASGSRIAYGNSEAATEIAQQYSDLMKTMTDEFFTGGKEGAVTLTKGKFLTHCHLNPDSCVLLVHVPQLRQYKGDVRDTLAEIAWTAARAIVMQHGLTEDATLAVGLRGAFLYGPVMVDSVSVESTASDLNSDSLHEFFKNAPESEEDAEMDGSEDSDNASPDLPADAESTETPAENQPATTDGEGAAPSDSTGDSNASETDKASDNPQQDGSSNESPKAENPTEATESAGIRRSVGEFSLAA